MKSGIFDKNGIEVKKGDIVIFPYIDPTGQLNEDNEDFRVEIVFEYGCFGYYTNTRFVPLFHWMELKKGDYVPNCGNKVLYTENYPFWIDNSKR